MKSSKDKGSKRSILKSTFCILIVFILVIVSLLFVWFNGLFGRINRVDGDEDTLSPDELESILKETDPDDPNNIGSAIDPDDMLLPSGPADSITDDDNLINILLVGQDRREGKGRQRSDSMVLCTINKSTKTLTLTSFLRDTWVWMPDRYYERLNVPYVIGGFSLLNSTLSYNFGVSADHSIEVDFSGFKDVINAIGGVEINLTVAEANYMNSAEDWNLVAGINMLDGEKALFYSRIRVIDNDLGRSMRQRNVLTAIFDKSKTLNFSDLYKIADAIFPMITTDMSNIDIIQYVIEIAPILPELKIVSQRIPADGAYAFARIDGKSVIFLNERNLEKNRQILKDTILEP